MTNKKKSADRNKERRSRMIQIIKWLEYITGVYIDKITKEIPRGIIKRVSQLPIER